MKTRKIICICTALIITGVCAFTSGIQTFAEENSSSIFVNSASENASFTTYEDGSFSFIGNTSSYPLRESYYREYESSYVVTVTPTDDAAKESILDAYSDIYTYVSEDGVIWIADIQNDSYSGSLTTSLYTSV